MTRKEKPTSQDESAIEAPPTTISGIIKRLGPGLIVAGSIVGSGELIATTKTGAEAGFWLLWLILIGCIIKVFVQVEFGRFSIVTGRSTMDGLNEVPGPKLDIALWSDNRARHVRANWIVWYWFLMWFASIGQLGGIVGGVGQALSISWPLTEEGKTFNEYVDHRTQLTVKLAEQKRLADLADDGRTADEAYDNQLQQEIDDLKKWLADADRPIIAELGTSETFNDFARTRDFIIHQTSRS